jgi:competence CoiA-like predicted nuclease
MLSCKAGNKIINTIDYEHGDIKKWSNKKILKCPMCDGEMLFRKGMIKIPHFAHKDACTEDKGYWENETKEHYLGKQLLYQWLKQFKDIQNLKLEAWIPQTKQRPDLMFDLLGETYVIEYQCSNLTLEQCLSRELLYKLMNIKSIWIFGTENFNKLKLKALEEHLFNNNKIIYYLNPNKPYFVKIEKDERSQFSYHDENLTHFFIDVDGKIIAYKEIINNFNMLLKNLIEKIQKEEMRYRSELLREQYAVYNSVYHDYLKELKENRKLASKEQPSEKESKSFECTKSFDCMSCEFNQVGYCLNFNKWCSIVKSKLFKEYSYSKDILERCQLRR